MINPNRPRPRRSALFMPASNPRAIEKARSLPCDVVILDLEDAVAPDAKAAARAAAVEAVNAGGFGTRELVVRVNALDTAWGADDLAALSQTGVDAVLAPKVDSAEDVARFNAHLTGAHQGLALWAMIETCTAMLSLREIAASAATSRLGAFVVGTNDLAKEMRAERTPCRTPFLPFFSLTVAAARAHGLAVLDAVCNDFRDLDAFEAEARQGRMFGFDGKSLIHPAQIAPANAVFGPSPERIAQAQAILAAFALPENAGKGAVDIDGQMVERLHLEEAQALLAMAERISATD
ncbi:HpcH/HpaI aldolase/citrate lyase family protein [Novosphingobium sp. 9]|uniref:HpcH/HpaI aldolase/citrate lyase family protein n=1 Tax=Novosphingobium sp. 9 TaxID=2025349 RepID=UPI0021B4E86F|nr:CoA ester lyase [Novosphingobium sp. 9]